MKNRFDMNELSFEKIYRKRYFDVCYFNEITPDDCIDRMERIKKIAVDKGYKDVIITLGIRDDNGCETPYISAEGVSLETDDEYTNRLRCNVFRLEQDKRVWKQKEKFYNDDYDGSHSDLIKKYENKISNTSDEKNRQMVD